MWVRGNVQFPVELAVCCIKILSDVGHANVEVMCNMSETWCVSIIKVDGGNDHKSMVSAAFEHATYIP